MIRLANLNQKSHGFTLMEVLLVVAIVSILTMVSAPLILSFQRTNELDVAGNTLVQYLYQAQSYSRNEAHDCNWGVTISGQNLTLFCGTSFAARNQIYDNVYEIPASITIQQNQEVVYDKLSGHPQSTGSYSLRATPTQIATVTVNNKGMVDY